MEWCLRAGMYDSKYKRFFHSPNNSHTAISGKRWIFQCTVATASLLEIRQIPSSSLASRENVSIKTCKQVPHCTNSLITCNCFQEKGIQYKIHSVCWTLELSSSACILLNSLLQNLLLNTSFPCFAMSSRTHCAVVLRAKAVPDSPCTLTRLLHTPGVPAKVKKEAVEVFGGTGASVLPRAPFRPVCLHCDIGKS